MNEWTVEIVRARFVEACDTERRMPRGRTGSAMGYWPSYQHTFEDMAGWGTKRLAEEQMQGVSIAQVTPNPYKIANRLSKEFQEAAAAKKTLEVPMSYAMMEGYIAGKVIVEAVRRQGAKPSREGMVRALDAMDRFDMGGYVVGYKPGSRAGSKFVELSIISGTGKIRQ